MAIDEDKYVNFGFEASAAITLSLDVRASGAPIDILVMDSLNFQSFQTGGSFRYFEQCSALQTQTFVSSCSLSSNSYYIILDNSDAGSVPAFNGVNDVANVNYDLRAY